MSELFEGKTMPELVDQGWIIVVDEDTDEVVGIRSVIPTWKGLTWAERTYYRAKYGFDEAGILDIGLSKSAVAPDKMGLFLRPALQGKAVTPAKSRPGSNDRLREILAQSRAGVETLPYNNGLAHTGLDGTTVITDEYFWGLPHPECSAEIADWHSCLWEDSLATWEPEAPWWAVGPEAADVSEFA